MKPSFNRQYHKNELKADERFEFQVETDPAIMKRLSDDVYEDPISAILRELATNAYDAHIDANNQDVPFDIDLPIGSNADFRIRDYGTGLSKEDLTQTYTRYAKSNRRDSNEHIGSIGIGSKSPFAYTNQFIVTSYFNGRAISALCARDEYHVPYLQIISEQDTTEKNGLEVKFPVETKDHKEFIKKAAIIYQWFDVQPNYNTDQVKNIKTHKNLSYFSGDNFLLHKGLETNSFQRRNAQVLMGNILYKTNIKTTFDNLIIKVPIGYVGITISREALQDTPQNSAKVSAKLKEVYQEIEKDTAKKVNSFATPYEAIGFLHKLSRSSNKPVIFSEYKGSKINSNGIDIKSAGTLSSVDRFFAKRGNDTDFLSGNDISNKLPIIYVDIKTGYVKAARSYLNKTNQIHGLLFSGNIDELQKLTGLKDHEIIRASDYYVKSTGKKRGTYGHIKIFKFRPDKGGVNVNQYSRFWEAVNYTTNNGKSDLYVPIKRYKPEVDINIHMDRYKDFIDFGKYNLFGVKPDKINWAISQNMKPLKDFIKNKGIPDEKLRYCKNIYLIESLSQLQDKNYINFYAIWGRLEDSIKVKLFTAAEIQSIDQAFQYRRTSFRYKNYLNLEDYRFWSGFLSDGQQKLIKEQSIKLIDKIINLTKNNMPMSILSSYVSVKKQLSKDQILWLFQENVN